MRTGVNSLLETGNMRFGVRSGCIAAPPHFLSFAASAFQYRDKSQDRNPLGYEGEFDGVFL